MKKMEIVLEIDEKNKKKEANGFTVFNELVLCPIY